MKSQHIYLYQNANKNTFGTIEKWNNIYVKVPSILSLDFFELEISKLIYQNKITNLDVFIHGFEAYYDFVKDDVIKKYEQSGFFSDDKRLSLHLDWKSIRWYPSNHKQIEIYNPSRIDFIEKIVVDNIININFICHSMGCYVFSRMVDLLSALIKNSIHKVVLAAPDMIPSDFRRSDWLMDNGHKILLFSHARDLTLKSASYFRKGERIGRKCPRNIKEIVNYREKPLTSDVSEYIIDKIFEHRYFYTDSSVRKTIIDFVLSD